MERLLAYRWPGNVRELENAIERAAVTSVGDTINLDKLPPRVAGITAEERPAFQIDLKHPLPYYLRKRPSRSKSSTSSAPGEEPGQRRPLRRTLRTLATQRLGKDQPIRDRQPPFKET